MENPIVSINVICYYLFVCYYWVDCYECSSGYYGGADTTDIDVEECGELCPDINYYKYNASCYSCPYEEQCLGSENCKSGYNGTLCLEVYYFDFLVKIINFSVRMDIFQLEHIIVRSVQILMLPQQLLLWYLHCCG